MALTVSWEKDGLRSNDVKVNLAGNNMNVDFEAKWDVSNLNDAAFEIEAEGNGPNLGKFEFERKVDWKCDSSKFKINIIGKSSSEKGWFAEKGLNPVDTKIKVIFDYNKMNLNADIDKVVAGKRYSVGVKDNMLTLNM